MNHPDFSLGRVVYSKMGRDQGKYFVVVAHLDENYVCIADGYLRRLNNPKKKKLKHLEPKPQKLESIAEKLEKSQKIFDSEVRSALEAIGYNNRA